MPVNEADPMLCRAALRELYGRYEMVIAKALPDRMALSNGRLGLGNLAWMCQTALDQLDGLPLDKTNRWLGFVQGCLAMRGLIKIVVVDVNGQHADQVDWMHEAEWNISAGPNSGWQRPSRQPAFDTIDGPSLQVGSGPVNEADPMLCRAALRELYARYGVVIAKALPDRTAFSNGRLGLGSLAWMCQTAIEQMDGLPLDKTNRWLGSVQGCLAMRGLIDVDEERDVSRPLFHAAYGGSERAPASLSQDGR